MIILPIYLTYDLCSRGATTCTRVDFPWISYTMGVYPNDKIYTFIFTAWACVMFSVTRAAFNRFLDKISPWANYTLLLFGMVTCFTGPFIACFDEVVDPSYPDYQVRKDLHKGFTQVFTVFRVLYLFGMTQVFVQVPELAQGCTARVMALNVLMYSMILFFLWGSYGAPYLGIEGDWNVFIEW